LNAAAFGPELIFGPRKRADVPVTKLI